MLERSEGYHIKRILSEVHQPAEGKYLSGWSDGTVAFHVIKAVYENAGDHACGHSRYRRVLEQVIWRRNQRTIPKEPSAMTEDRVRFFLSVHRVNSNLDKYTSLLETTFKLKASRFFDCVQYQQEYDCAGVVLECTPAQFAHFIIERNRLGLQNGLKELFARFLSVQPGPDYLDVSNVANGERRHWSECR
jgi:hypothetical protein